MTAPTCQQDQAYAAERLAPRGRRFHSLDALREYVDDLVNQSWWHERFPAVEEVHVQARPGPRDEWGGVASYEGGRGVLELVVDDLHERLVLHEVAHVCASAELGSGVGHGPHWARLYLELVYRRLGTEAWLALRGAFDTHEVDYD